MDKERAGARRSGADPASQPESEPDAETEPETGSDAKLEAGPGERGGSASIEADPRTTIAGRYTVDLTSPPTTTGIAVAHRGRDLRTRDPVVVKTLRLEYRGDPEMRARFRREARLLQFLSHPNVIRALTFTEERGAPWLVLEHVQGTSLRQKIAAEAPFTPVEVVPIVQGLAAALDHLHARGLVHLDVRPENVVVTPDGEVKLIDFGVAQTAGTMQEAADGAADDPAYLAPEQTCGEPVSAATDVYALGCVVYELLTGTPPFAAERTPAGRNAAIRARLEQAPTPPTAARGGDVLPAWVDDVVLGALERDPQRRYGSAGSFATVFRSGIEGHVDVETGRPLFPPEPARGRQIPVNEPGIAMKGSPRLASRRAEATGEAEFDGQVMEAAYSPLTPHSAADFTYLAPRRARGPNVDTLHRRLWQAVILAVLLNVLLIAALVMTQGEIPGLWNAAPGIGPGATVRIAGTGLVAREEPETSSAIVANLPEGGEVRLTGEPVPGDSGLWWPVEVETVSGPVSGYVPEAWVQQP